MAKTQPTPVSVTADDARAALSRARTFDDFLAGMGQRDRTNIERHLAVVDADADPAHGRLWRRLAATLGTLAPAAVQTTGQQAVQFFIPDGKYRMQVFALEDQRDGLLRVYSPDALADARRAKLVADKPPTEESVPGPGGDRKKILVYRFATANATPGLLIEPLEAKNTANPAPFFANLIGWNRKAVRITVPVGADDEAVGAVETFCALGGVAVASRALPAVPKVPPAPPGPAAKG
jgi:hypothetical protein